MDKLLLQLLTRRLPENKRTPPQRTVTRAMMRPRLIRLAATQCSGGLVAGPAPWAASTASKAAASTAAAAIRWTASATRTLSTQSSSRPQAPRSKSQSRTWSQRARTQQWSRPVHTLPDLSLNQANGVPGLLSPTGFKTAWTDYQKLLIARLNVMVAGGL